jgi:hypothetical protein
MRRGGLKMSHVECFCHGLKMVWINKILEPLKITPWKTLFIDQHNKYGADKIWIVLLSSYGPIITFSFNFCLAFHSIRRNTNCSVK